MRKAANPRLWAFFSHVDSIRVEAGLLRAIESLGGERELVASAPGARLYRFRFGPQ